MKDSITIICKKCNKEKELSLFYKSNKRVCIECVKAYESSDEKKEKNKIRRAERKKIDADFVERRRLEDKIYRERHKEEIRERQKQRYLKIKNEIGYFPKRIRKALDSLDVRAKKYNITKDIFLKMVEAQNGKCYVCGKELGKSLSIDHDHNTGKVRKLLCGSCNVALGFVKENPDTLKKLAKYIELHTGE